jgi:hypothetical protein
MNPEIVKDIQQQLDDGKTDADIKKAIKEKYLGLSNDDSVAETYIVFTKQKKA